MYWIEIRRTTIRLDKIKLVPLSNLPLYTQGFRSVYAYTDETKEYILKENSTAGLEDHDVYSDTLFVDFDNQPESSKAFAIHLNNMGIKYDVYHSGNRSFHFHVHLVKMFGKDVPYSQKEWMKNNSTNSDLSFYHTSGMYRLVGTIHFKTRKPKVLLYSHQGKLLDISKVNKPTFHHIEVSDDYIERSHEDYDYMLFMRYLSEGNRRNHMFKIAMKGIEVGISDAQIISDCIWFNHRLHLPLDDIDVIQYLEPILRRHR